MVFSARGNGARRFRFMSMRSNPVPRPDLSPGKGFRMPSTLPTIRMTRVLRSTRCTTIIIYYVAVDVADDNIISDNPDNPWLDDGVEIFIDSDNQPFDMDAINGIPDWFGVLPNNEGFQLVTSAGNVAQVYPSPVIQVDSNSSSALRPRGFLIETRISLDSINTIDNSWWTDLTLPIPDFDNDPTKPLDPNAVFAPVFRRPQPGDSIGFNVVVEDDDSGRQPGNPDPFQDSINRTDLVPNPSSYTAWDGSSPNWYYADEEAWGTLYLAP